MLDEAAFDLAEVDRRIDRRAGASCSDRLSSRNSPVSVSTTTSTPLPVPK
jgi:hypothetical protein